MYTRSALGRLFPRLAHHLRKDKKCHWHIDALTRVARVEEIVIDASGTRTECQWHEIVMQLPGARMIVPGFGSSDCRCPSHVAYFEQKPSLLSQTLDGELFHVYVYAQTSKAPTQPLAGDPVAVAIHTSLPALMKHRLRPLAGAEHPAGPAACAIDSR
ncbi:MAG: DUF123 domain-containing protein [Nitrospirae bacterium]|nr:MAG: DUF123 domain-containing protein [Nitrospirota bacterium]